MVAEEDYKVEVVAEMESRDYKVVERAVDYKVEAFNLMVAEEEDYKVEAVKFKVEVVAEVEAVN